MFSRQYFSVPLNQMYRFTKVFLLTSQILVVIPSYPPYNVKSNNCFSCKRHLQHLSLVRFFSVLYIATLHMFVASFPIYGSACAGTTLKISTSEQRGHVVYSSWFSFRRKSHWPLLPLGTGYSRFFPRVAATMSSTQVVKKCRNKPY